MEIVGYLGVAILLGAFLANVRGWVQAQSKLYQGANALGAGLAAYASWLIDYMPFVVLEGVWCLVAVAALLGHRPDTRDSSRSTEA